MTRRFTDWLTRRWQPTPTDELATAYQVTFSTPHGRMVLDHMLNEIYGQVCPTKDPIDLATHNGRRSVVQEILENIERADHPTTIITEVS